MATWVQKGTRSMQSVQTTTDSAPTTEAEGVNLDSVSGFILHVSCDLTRTFSSTAGQLDAYLWNESQSIWSRAPAFDVTIGLGSVGTRGYSETFFVESPRARIAHIANGIAVSAGGLTLDYRCSLLRGDQA